MGLHIGMEFVEDPATKVPDLPLAQAVKHIALEMGLILGEAGYRMNVLKIKPPLIISQAQAEEVLTILDKACALALEKLASQKA